MSYTILMLRRAQRELAKLPIEAYEPIRDAIYALAETSRPPACLKLKNREGWRIRIGDYRVIYEIDDEQKVVTVLDVGNRRDIYR
jgi:mRNA interferase RelE/StbE